MGFDIGLGLEAAGATDVLAGLGGDALAAGATDALAGGVPLATEAGGFAADAGLAAGATDALAGGVPLATDAGLAATGAGAADLGAAGAGAADVGAAGLAAEGAVTAADTVIPAAFSGDIGAFGGPSAGDLAGVASDATVPVSNFGAGGGVNMPISPPAGASPSSAFQTAITPSQVMDQSAGGASALDVSGGDILGTTPPTPGASAGDMLSPQAPATPITSPASQGSVAPSASATPTASAAAGSTPAASAASKGLGGGGGGSGSDWMWKAAGLGLAAAPLAITLGRGEQPLPPQAAQLSQNNVPLQNFANSYLQNVQNNQPTPAQAAQLASDRQGLVNQWRQALFNQGVQNPESDSRWPQIMAQIDQQINQENQAFIQTNLQAALSGSGQASGNLIALANMQIAQDTAFQNAISGASRAAGGVVGLMGR